MSKSSGQSSAPVPRARALGLVGLGVLALLALCILGWIANTREKSSLVPKAPPSVPVVTVRTYLELPELPKSDEEAKLLIRNEYYNFDGYTVVTRESDIPLEKLLVPDEMFTERELKIIADCIGVIGGMMGKDDPVFLALKEWAARKDGRLIGEVLPLTSKFAIRNGNYQYGIDAFWSPEMKYLYIGRHQLPYFTLLISTLYQEAFHAVQLRGRKLSKEQNAAIELEAHQAQMAFNAKLREAFRKMKDSRRMLLELEVVDENLRDSIAAYKAGKIDRTGIPIPAKKR